MVRRQKPNFLFPRSSILGLQEVERYNRLFCTPVEAAKRGFLDEVISPASTRARICEDLERLKTKSLKNPEKKHCNIPL